MKYENIEISDQSTNFLFVDRKALISVFHGIDKVLLPGIPEASIAEITAGAATEIILNFHFLKYEN